MQRIVVFTLYWCAGLALRADEPVELTPAATAGQRILVDQGSVVHTLDMSDGGHVRSWSRRCLDEVVAVEVGRPSLVRRRYLEYVSRAGREPLARAVPHVLHGNEVELASADGTTTATGTLRLSGATGAAAVSRLVAPDDVVHEAIDDPWSALLPVGSTRVGSSWELDAVALTHALGGVFGGVARAEGRAELTSLGPGEGSRGASVALAISAEINREGAPTPTRVAMTGRLWFDFDARAVTRLALSSADVRARAPQPGEVACRYVLERCGLSADKGLAHAHRTLAERYFADRAARESSESAEFHDRCAVAVEPDHPDSHRRLLVILQHGKRFAEAEAHVAALDRLNAIDRVTTAHFYAQWGRHLVGADAARSRELQSRADELLAQVVVELSRAIERTPDNTALRLKLASALALLCRFSEAEAVLLEGWRRAPSDAVRKSLGALYAAWATPRVDSTEDPKRRLELVLQCLTWTPHDPSATVQLAGLAEIEGEVGSAARSALELQVVGAPDPARVYVMLASVAWHWAEHARALRYLERAAASPSALSSLIANNRAYYLAHQPSPDLPRALANVESAIAQDPAQMRYLDTRGRILAKLGRDREAVRDLERAAPHVRRPSETYALLAELHDRLGDPERAARCRARAAEPAPPGAPR